MALVAYPESFPVEAATYYVGLLRKTETLQKDVAIHFGWNLAGYLAKVGVGEPEAITYGEPVSVTPETIALAIEALDPEKPQAVVFGGIGKKLLFAIVMRIIEKVVAGAELPASLETLINEILGGLIGAE